MASGGFFRASRMLLSDSKPPKWAKFMRENFPSPAGGYWHSGPADGSASRNAVIAIGSGLVAWFILGSLAAPNLV